MNLEKDGINLLDLPNKIILDVIKLLLDKKLLDYCDLYISVRQACRRLRSLVDNFIQLNGIFLLASERDEFDNRLPTEILYVFSKDNNSMSICTKELPPFPNPFNSYDTEDYQITHISDVGFFGTVIDTNRIVVGLYCKERWKNLHANVGKKEARRKLKPKSHAEDREHKISESEGKLCIYWSKNDGEDSKDDSAAKIFTTNTDTNEKSEMNLESDMVEPGPQNTPRLALGDMETESNEGDRYLLIPYLYEYNYSSEKWMRIELSAIHPLIYPFDVQCQLAFCQKDDSILVELRIQKEEMDDIKTLFIKFSRNEDFKGPSSHAHEALKPIDSSNNFTDSSTLSYHSGLCDIGQDIISFYEINQRWWHQGALQNYGNERRWKDNCSRPEDHYKKFPRNFFTLNQNLYFIKEGQSGLTIQKYCPKQEKFCPTGHAMPFIVEYVNKIITAAMENFAIIFGYKKPKQEKMKSNPIVMIFTENDGAKDMNIYLSHYSCDTGILMRIR